MRRRPWTLRWRSTAGALALLLLGSGTAEGQWSRPSGWHRLSVGAGPAWARSVPEPRTRAGIAGMAAFELLALERLELRFSGTLLEGTSSEELQLGGVALDAVVFPWRGTVAPYVGAGVGAYQFTVEDGDPLADPQRLDHKGWAWTALLGLRVRAGPLTPFVEWRHTAFGADAPVRRYSPLLIGLHF